MFTALAFAVLPVSALGVGTLDFVCNEQRDDYPAEREAGQNIETQTIHWRGLLCVLVLRGLVEADNLLTSLALSEGGLTAIRESDSINSRKQAHLAMVRDPVHSLSKSYCSAKATCGN
jgi:hypothetical protein